jgi:stage II sporulation protein M
MMDSLNNTIRRHLADNIWLYLIVLFVFILGISLGALTVNTIDDVSENDARQYIEGFLDLTSQNDLQATYILKQSIKYNLYFAMILFFSSLVYLGIVIIPALIAFRGFCIGFSVAFLTGNFGGNGFLLSIGSILPQNIIYIPIIMVMGVSGLNYSLWAFRNRYLKKYPGNSKLFAPYAFSTLTLFILLISGCIVESYVTSIIIKAITPYVG